MRMCPLQKKDIKQDINNILMKKKLSPGEKLDREEELEYLEKCKQEIKKRPYEWYYKYKDIYDVDKDLLKAFSKNSITCKLKRAIDNNDVKKFNKLLINNLISLYESST